MALAVAAAAVPLAVGGCDTDAGRADKSVDQTVSAAEPMAGGSMANEAEASHTLDGAATALGVASTWQQARTHGLHGDAELRIAQAYSAQAEFYARQITQLSVDVGRMTAAIQASDADAAALLKQSPEKIEADLKEKSAAIAGSADKQSWVDTKAGSLTSLAADDKAAADLKAEVDRLNESIKGETADRDGLLASADQLSDQGNKERGDKAVAVYTQSSDARKKAADLNVKIDADQVALGRAQADLDAATKQQESKRAAVKELDEAKSAVEVDWAAVQERAEAEKKAVKAAVGDPVNVATSELPEPLTPDAAATAADKKKLDLLAGGKTISSKAATLLALTKRNHDLRGQAETHFNAAINFYRQAAEAATKLDVDLSSRDASAGASEKVDYVAVQDLKKAVHPGTYNYLRATAELSQAEFFARSAAEARMQLDVATRLKPAVEAAGLSAPAGLDETAVAELTKQEQSATQTARGAFKAAIDQLTKLPEGGDASAEIKDGAQVAVIFANYGLAQLEIAAGDTGTASAGPLGLAKEKVRNAIDTGLYLPPLPAELAAATAKAMPMAPTVPAMPGKPAMPTKPVAPAKPAAKK